MSLDYARMLELVHGYLQELEIKQLQQDRIKEAVDRALDAVYEEWNTFQGYDPQGYLEYYKVEMTSRGVPEDQMISAFGQLVDAGFKDVYQEVIKSFSEQWNEFADALIHASSVILELEINQISLSK